MDQRDSEWRLREVQRKTERALRRAEDATAALAGRPAPLEAVAPRVKATRHRALRQNYRRVRVTENDLARLAAIVERHAVETHGGELEIRVETADGQDTIRASTANVFTSPDEIPSELRAVEIGYVPARGGSELHADVVLASSPRGLAEIRVEGSDTTTATALFWELRRELDSKRLAFCWLTTARHSALFQLLVSLFLGASTYVLFDFVLDLASARVEGFHLSALHVVLQAIGWLCVGIAFFVGSSWFFAVLERAFPVVEFAERLHDPGAAGRGRVLWIVTAVLLPFVLDGLRNLALEFLGTGR